MAVNKNENINIKLSQKSLYINTFLSQKMADGLYLPRRDFLKTTGLALAMTAVPTSLDDLAQGSQQRRYAVYFEPHGKQDA